MCGKKRDRAKGEESKRQRNRKREGERKRKKDAFERGREILKEKMIGRKRERRGKKEK